MPIKSIFKEDNQWVPVKIWTEDYDGATKVQLQNVASLPFIHHHVSAMPDVHLGYGATIGSVIPTYKAIIPSAVGVDIGCGMNAVRLSIKADQLPDNLLDIRTQIERDIPLGAGAAHKSNPYWSAKLNEGLYNIVTKHPGIMDKPIDRAMLQMGTLGSGNHFIEICIDEDDYVWIMLHSGSRGIGNRIGNYFIDKAKEEMERWHIDLPDKDLAYLPEGTQLFDDYVEAVHWAQDYALDNRATMMRFVIRAMQRYLPAFTITQEAINCHHNYVEKENHYGRNVFVTRKGAIRAREGELGIIPGSMGAKSFIVRGKGNAESFCSCSHGAGRKLSRTQAKAQYTLDDLREQTAGIECGIRESVIDEIPAAYKSIDEVMENQSDLVEVVHTLKQVVNVKG